MTLFGLIRHEVTARDAARLYGLRFDRGGRGFCPWHDDGRHAALKFYDNGGCYCFSCHAYGDATAITAQILGLSAREAAERIQHDFHLDKPAPERTEPMTDIKAKQRQGEHAAKCKRWSFLCDVIHEADTRLMKFTPDTITPEFDRILAARCRAETEMFLLEEDFKHERVGGI